MKKKLQKSVTILLLSLTVFSSGDILAQASDSTKAFPRWRAEMVAEDLVQLDELSSLALQQEQIIADLWSTIYTRDLNVTTLERTIALQDSAYNRLLLRELKAEKIAMAHESRARKYKRQRNGVLAGVVIVGTAVLVKGISLKR